MEAHGRELGIDNLMSPGRPHKGNKKIRWKLQTPPDLVVKSQDVDTIDVIL
jgi:hypothetical protein